MAARQAALEQAFRAGYLRYQYLFVEFFVAHLAELNRIFRGDLQQALVLAVIGQVQLQAANQLQPRSGRTLPDGVRRPAISASRIADVACIPRETVRRKLQALVQQGWVEPVAGGWRLRVEGSVSAARRDFDRVDREALQRIAALVADLETLA